MTPATRRWRLRLAEGLATQQQDEIVHYEKALKMPAGCFMHLTNQNDSDFLGHLCNSVFLKQKDAMAALGGKKCACCGKYADGFVTEITHSFPQSEEEVTTRGFLINVQRAYPACRELVCNQRLREYNSSQTGSEKYLMAMCENCGKHEHGDVKHMKCSRCKLRYYCSRECQKQDWPNHKQMCKKVEPADK